MRNLFDQYSQPENRLTHALVCSLANDRALLGDFVRWATDRTVAPSQLTVIEQSLPGEEEPADEADSERRSLPDAWIYSKDGWCLIVESKIECPLTNDQLQRHLNSALRRGFRAIHLLALVTDVPKRDFPRDVRVVRWTDLYCWLRRTTSGWARRLTTYMEVLEGKLVRDDYLTGGTLTVFSGMRFGNDEPYTYLEAKRLLSLMMEELRTRKELRQMLGADPDGSGRSAITGRDSLRIWDFLPLLRAKEAASFTEFPHLTISLDQEKLLAIVTVPNGIRREFRRNLVAGGYEQFHDLFEKVHNHLANVLRRVEGASPWIDIVQRRYPSQRSEPIYDARLQFDLGTTFGRSGPGDVKHQAQWLKATYEALAGRGNSNLQLGVGAVFPYDRCDRLRTPQILDDIANTWIACKPLIDRLIGSPRARAASAS
jgi:hypothetical protein